MVRRSRSKYRPVGCRFFVPEQVKPGFTNYQPRGLVKQILEFKQNKKFKNSEIFFKFKNPDLKRMLSINY